MVSKKQQELVREAEDVRKQFEAELAKTEEELRRLLWNLPVPKGDDPQIIITI